MGYIQMRLTYTLIVSPQFATMVGPGVRPLMSMHTLWLEPSGAQVVFSILRLYDTVTPVFGHEVYMSVEEAVNVSS